MQQRIKRLLQLREGEFRLVLVLGLLLFFNALAMQLAEITAVSGFLNVVGVNQMLIVWVISALLLIGTMSAQSLIIDRFDRITLIKWTTLAFAVLFVLLRLLFNIEAMADVNYGLFFLLSTQQQLLFPLVFWILANDIFNVVQSKRLLPLLASLGLGGQLIGILLAAALPGLLAQLQVNQNETLTLNAMIYLVIFGVILLGLQNVKIRATRHVPEPLRETLTEGWQFVREIPAFRFLMLAIIALIFCETVVEFHFLVVTGDLVEADQYQQFYSMYALVRNLASIAIQAVLTSRLINRISLKNTFLIMPVAALLSIGIMLAFPLMLIPALLAIWMEKLPQYTVDESARKSFQALVPEERRGRVSIFMDSYLNASGAIMGSMLIGLIIIVGDLAGLDEFVPFVYLGFGFAAAIFAIWSILRMRTVYDSSMFNWRLKRRQRRASVLDKLDF